MAEKLNTECGCKIVGAANKEKDETYCCEPCIISSSQCGCGRHTIVEQPEKKK